MLGMFAVFAVLFFKDWRIGYPKKNLVYYSYAAFEEAKEEFASRDADGLTAAAWEAFAADKKLPVSEGGILPEGTDDAWPDELRSYELYAPVFREESMKAAPPGWIGYSDRMGWDEKPPPKSYGPEKIRNQSIYGGVSAAAALLTLVIVLRTMGRSMKADQEAYYAPDGKKVPFRTIRRIDKRKWETKGLAYLFYEEVEGRVGKVKVDGMVYGQFREEDGAPAEQLFQRILKNFSGELVDLELAEDAAGAGSAGGGAED
jgi:hypothetical protein